MDEATIIFPAKDHRENNNINTGIRGAAEEAVLNKLHKNFPALTVKLKKGVVYRKEVWQENAYIVYPTTRSQSRVES